MVVCYLAFSEDNIDKMKGERNETLSLEKYGELSRGEFFFYVSYYSLSKSTKEVFNLLRV